MSIVQSIALIVNESGHASDNFISYFNVADTLIKECKTFSGDLYAKLVRTLGESLQLVDVGASLYGTENFSGRFFSP